MFSVFYVAFDSKETSKNKNGRFGASLCRLGDNWLDISLSPYLPISLKLGSPKLNTMRFYKILFSMAIVASTVSCDKSEIFEGAEVPQETTDIITLVQEDGSEVVHTIKYESKDVIISHSIDGTEGGLASRTGGGTFYGKKESSEPNSTGGRNVTCKPGATVCYVSSHGSGSSVNP